MINEPEAQPLSNTALQEFEFGIDKFEHRAVLNVDQVVMVRIRRGLISRASIAEVMLLQDTRLFEQANGAINGSDRDARIDSTGAFVQLFDIRVVFGIRQDARDDPALLRDTKPLFMT